MAQGMHKVKRRIQTVESTRKITSAMKLVSSVKFSRYQKALESKREYLADLNDFAYAVFNVAKDRKLNRFYFKENKDSEKTLYIVVTSSMGLCGSYKHNVQKYLENVYKKGDEIVLIGTSLLGTLEKDPDLVVEKEFINIAEGVSMAKTRVLARYCINKFNTKQYKKISLIYTHYKNVISYEVKEFSLFPIEFERDKKYSLNAGDFEPSIEFIFEKFINKYLSASLYLRLFESYLSEQSSRRNAMDNADKNAEELIDKLTLEYNKARQAAITQEITEVVAGGQKK